MIAYDSNDLSFLFKCEGSVIPKSFLFAIPSVGLTVCSHVLRHSEGTRGHFNFIEEVNQWSVVWSACVIVLGMLLGVRTNKAYGRFWEGITLVQQMRAEWFEATSNLMAFSMVASKKNKEMTSSVNEFQSILIRLMSLMHGAALRQIGGNEEEFDVLDISSLDDESLRYLADCEQTDINRVEVILHWIQVLVTDGASNGVIVVAPPILTRAYQTLSRGMVNLHNARKLADVPFPFPLSQMTLALLILQSVFTPIVVSGISDNLIVNVFICFVPIFGMWGLTFVAGELEQPFGSDPNDLPLSVLQYDFNTTLLMLLDKEVSRAPVLINDRSRTANELRVCLTNHESFDQTNFAQLCYSDLLTTGQSRRKTTGSHQSQLEERKKKRRSTIANGPEEKRLLDPPKEQSPQMRSDISEDGSSRPSECSSNLTGILKNASTNPVDPGSIPEAVPKTVTWSPPSCTLAQCSPSNGGPDFALTLTEQRVEELLDASTQASKVLTALLREPFVKVLAHRDRSQPNVLAHENEDGDEIPKDFHRLGPTSRQVLRTPPLTPCTMKGGKHGVSVKRM